MAELALAIAPIAWKALVAAWDTLDDALDFSPDSEDLLIRLETARAHLKIWATLSGLADAGGLRENLLPFEELIARALKRISTLFSDADRLKSEYGITMEDSDGDEKPGKQRSGRAAAMRRFLHLSIHRRDTNLAHMIAVDSTSRFELSSSDPGVSKRFVWGIKDKARFEGFVSLVETHVDGLHKLLQAEQRMRAAQAESQYHLTVVQGVSDPVVLSNLQRVPDGFSSKNGIKIRGLAQMKAIAVHGASYTDLENIAHEDLNVDETSVYDRRKLRFVRRGRIEPETYYLFEKKAYDLNISDNDKDLLRERVQKLLALLAAPKSNSSLHTLQAVGYVDDPQFGCWWIAFRFPLFLSIREIQGTSEPLSLRKLLVPQSGIRPSLEQRYGLARRLVGVFAKLYGSGWMHKSINSDNIIFPQLYDQETLRSFRSLGSALLQGFGYSRQHSEAQTIDRGKVLGHLESAIYRHPNYQGDAASGYQIHYDIYSLGLVLFEIGMWSPIIDLLAATPRQKPPVELSPKMEFFHELEALELKRRAQLRIKVDLPFRMGSKYAEVVDWCLNLNGPVNAVEFYDSVTLPLNTLFNNM